MTDDLFGKYWMLKFRRAHGEPGLLLCTLLILRCPYRQSDVCLFSICSNLQFLLSAGKGPPIDAQDDKEYEKGEGSEDETEEEKISKRKRKLESRLKIAELKQTCPRPEVVEVWDVTAQDPRLLVYLKVSQMKPSTACMQLSNGGS